MDRPSGSGKWPYAYDTIVNGYDGKITLGAYGARCEARRKSLKDADWRAEFCYQSNWQTVQIGSKWWGLSAARLYDFTAGRFTQRDPIHYSKQDLNLYMYAYPNPLVVMDATGKALPNDAAAPGAGGDLIYNEGTSDTYIEIPTRLVLSTSAGNLEKAIRLRCDCYCVPANN
jgi:RHS repeat-associated protein